MYIVWSFIAIFSVSQWCVNGNTCLTSGRYPNDDIPNCRGYVMCIANGNGGFFQYNLTCPQTFVFSPLDKVCTNVTNYHCDTMVVPFDCKSIGNFENALSEDCGTFIACNLNYDNTITARIVDCPLGFIFNSVQGDCVNGSEYECSFDGNIVPDVIEVNITEVINKNNSSNSAYQNQATFISVVSLITFVVLNTL